jgi:hypothetical protein
LPLHSPNGLGVACFYRIQPALLPLELRQILS